ncbi:MAG: SpoIIE family protein phosphatase [Pontiellaceae bacterium]|nr:SpoIIE family protein phosphatase [Pontiellaceae bacterium]MBN2783183.1 SpoIIE family protein phosphatase [Pontiellaceae bacterium]
MTPTLNEAELIETLMNTIRDNIYFMDRSGRIILINRGGARWLGFDSPEDAVGKTDLDIFTSEHGRAAFEDGQRIMETGIPMLGKEEKETWSGGRETWVSTSKIPMRDRTGKMAGLFGISRDITDHKVSKIRAARLAEQNRRFAQQLNDELAMAGELQKTFFPSAYPSFTGNPNEEGGPIEFSHLFRAGSMVGGIFCSIRRISDHEAGVFLCDVSGHGVRAALGAAILYALEADVAQRHEDPGRFLTVLNRKLAPIFQREETSMSCTACYVVINVDDGSIRYAHAGHQAPLHIQQQTRRVVALSGARICAGPALAQDAGSVYESISCKLDPGDSVVLFADGITRVCGKGGEMFGLSRLCSAARTYMNLPLKELFEILLDEAGRFSLSGRLDDDACLAGFHFKARSA